MWPFGKPSPAKFARLVARTMKQRGIASSIEYDEEDFALKSEAHVFYLANMYAEYCATPLLRRRKALHMFVESFLETRDDQPQTLDDVRPKLLPKLRERFFHDVLQLRNRLKAPQFPAVEHRVLAQHLAVDVVVDMPKSVKTVSSEDLDRWGLGFDEALDIARDNLWKISNEPFGELMPGTYVSTWGDTHDASRMFLHDLVWQLDVKGKHVAMVPDRNVLLVTGSEDAEGLGRLAQETKHILEHSPRPMTGLAFVLEGTAWQPFLPPVDSPAYDELRLLTVQSMGSMYDEQKAILDKIQEQDGTDIFVATFAAVGREADGHVYSWCTWAQDVDSLLPGTHLVALSNPESPAEKMLGFAEWEQLASVAGDLMEPCDGLYPARYRVRGFPSTEWLDRLELIEI